MFGPVSNFFEHSENETVSLEHLNEELWALNIPAVVFVLFCMILGLFGNIIVVYIYWRTFHRSNHRYFILCLAFLDLIGCLIGGSYMTYSLRLPYLMTSSTICKISRYFHYLVNQGSALLLLVIAVERFRKICRPFKKQISHRQTFLLCVITVGFSAVVSIPAAVLYGDSTIITGVNNISGITCFITDEYHNSIFSKSYMIFLLVETVVITVVMGVLYTFIIRTLWSQKNLVHSDAMLSVRVRNNTDVASTNSYSLEYLDESDKTVNCKNRIDKDDNQTHIKNTDNNLYQKNAAVISHSIETLSSQRSKIKPHATNVTKITSFGLDSQSNKNFVGKVPDLEIGKDRQKIDLSSKATKHGKTCNNNSTKSDAPNKVTKEKQRKRSVEVIRVTFMLFLITLVFCLSFYPHLVLIQLATSHDAFVENLTAPEVSVFQLFLRIFIINNSANPIIYGLCDSKFRTECRNLFRRTFRC
ncbi:hypothetical protein ACJMK2_027101 [Sinanodonta woodiana]|uniref:G-protein coupled receptors family 1 profile domain-containing protein n=1 Tax=Sinanodonta woodiana TaxID=1069815 RepID=A0ABD3XNV7_SINWO